MIFLVNYRRSAGTIVTLRSFDNSDRVKAENARLELELALGGQQADHEVVLLEASSTGALRQTHRRYFETAGQIARSTSTS